MPKNLTKWIVGSALAVALIGVYELRSSRGADNFQSFPPALSSPAANSVAVTPNDSTDLTISSRGIYVGATGNLAVTMVGDTTGTNVVFVNVAAGTVYPFRCKRVWATGTTATNIVEIY